MDECPIDEGCPPDEELRRYVAPDDPALDADRRRRIGAHLETCARCQGELDRWTKGLARELLRGHGEGLCSRDGGCESGVGGRPTVALACEEAGEDGHLSHDRLDELTKLGPRFLIL